jgi:hypothetical protein
MSALLVKNARSTLTALVLITLFAGRATAAAVPELLGGPSAGGFNARSTGAGAGSAYFNPALLPSAPETYDFDFLFLWQDLSISLKPAPASAGVSEFVNAAFVMRNGKKELLTGVLATSDLERQRSGEDKTQLDSYLSIGFTKRLYRDRVVLGLYALLPADKFQSQDSFFVDEREATSSNQLRFELLGDRLSMSTFALSVGSRLGRWLSVGAGFSSGLNIGVKTPVYVPNANDYTTSELNANLSATASLAPHAGIAVYARPDLTFSATIHAPSKIEIEGLNQIKVLTQTRKNQEFRFVQGYEPLTVGLGGDWKVGQLGGAALSLAGTVKWRRWSGYEDRHGFSPESYQGVTGGTPVGTSWKDTFTGALGARYARKSSVLHLDGEFVPSPVPDQTSRTNYVDGTRVAVRAGYEVTTTVLGYRVYGGVQLQMHRIMPRTTEKDEKDEAAFDFFPDDARIDPDRDPREDTDPEKCTDPAGCPVPGVGGIQTNNPGFPGYSSEAWLLGGGVTLRAVF